ncbi:glycogen debranching protein GlgX [Sphingomonas sp. HHU CXW]|uniref:Glycogen debranching protein GlgX n=1 Tax=Sphingomonas hominis TaxID=2741495 RepID=A0ABX2JHR4_9SPHN|nr:glycogen debranching protein GlgX [Sphingomonas hominis]NTS63962.1 glycogen debranching protein GlgX [Sphingomonas hominis]
MSSPELGARVGPHGTSFAVRAPAANAVWLCLFDGEAERRVAMTRDRAIWRADVPGAGEGTRYGYRADGPPPHDASKLLIDPYATTLNRAFAYDPALTEHGIDSAALVPKAVVSAHLPLASAPPVFRHGGLIYEVNVRAFTMLHPDVPEAQRGTIAAVAHPAVIAHLRKLGVDAVELMPVVAWVDERHLPPLGLANAWGYNPVVPMALDPRLAPGGVAELRDTVAALRQAGIGVILDLVFNHTGESDALGPTLSLRGLDAAAYARDGEGRLINDAGTGNTLDFANPAVRNLTLATMRHFVANCGVDGFRFDLATVMARGPGFDAHAPIFAEIAADPLLADRVLIAEPWDTGPGGYQLGAFPPNWLEWNDRFRDDVRRFWRGDGSSGALATRLSGSSDVFGDHITRSVNFVAAHDGFTLADTVAHAERHNHANGENNRDGHAHEVSWSNGAEGACDDASIAERRHADQRALLATLFASRGTIMLTAGDEFGRSQAGNNNAYAQDNATTWLDWHVRDRQLEDYVAGLSRQRRACAALTDPATRHDARWRRLDGGEMVQADWDSTAGFAMTVDGVTLRISRDARSVTVEQG